jgi:probable HAF family extracellular repeat protein
MLKHGRFTIAAVLISLVAAAWCDAAEYEIIDLGTLGGAETYARGINEAGQVVGNSLGASGYHAFLWEDVNGNGQSDPGEMTDVGDLGGAESVAFDINEAGQVVGLSYTASGQVHAFLWMLEAGMIDLGTLGGAYSLAYAINDAGQVVGYSYTAGGSYGYGSYHAFLWTPGAGMIDLVPLGGDSGAGAINEAGQVAGGSGHAFLWEDVNGNGQSDPGEMIDLGTLGGPQSGSSAINDAGQVVGNSYTASGERHAFLWTLEAGMIDLGTLGGSNSYAYAINDAGQVVGQSETASGSWHAFLWEDVNGNGQSDPGEMVDLGTLGGLDSGAHGINDAGQVAGYAQTASGSYHASLWVAVNGPPVAVALVNGHESIVVEEESWVGTTVTLDGSGSYDPDEDALTYEWDFTGDGTVDSTEATVQAVYSVGGPYTATLTVTDPSGEVSTDTVTITVVPGSPANQLLRLRQQYITDHVASGHIEAEMEQSLLAKVDAAIAALARGNANDAKVVMNNLKALVNQVEAQTDKKIDPAVAAEIIARANRISAALGGQ